MSDEENNEGLESKVRFSHEYAEQEQERKNYATGWHFAAVTAASKRLSKEKPETQGVRYKMLEVTFKPVRDQNALDSAVGRGLRSFQCLPFWDESWDELDYEVETKEGPIHVLAMLKRNMGIFTESTTDMLAALDPENVPSRPKKIGEVYTLGYGGEEIEKSQYKEYNDISKKAGGDTAEALWNNGPESLIDKGCYILIAYDEGSDWPNIKAFSATPPVDRKTGEVLELVPANAIMGQASKPVSDEKPVSKSNGASKVAPKANTGAKAKTQVKGKAARR